MKAQIIRDDLEVAPADADKPEFQDRVVRKSVMRDGALRDVPFWRMGAVLESPDCHWLVRFGVAIPADEACAVRVNRTADQMAAAQLAQEMMARRIEPEDKDLFVAEVITGVDANGEFIPGPNWDKLGEYRELSPPNDVQEDEEV